MSTLKTGIVYDPIFLKHTQPGHPENADRLNAIIKNLESTILLPLLEKVLKKSGRYLLVSFKMT